MKSFIQALSKATSVDEVRQTIKSANSQFAENVQMGIEKVKGRSVNAMRKEANAKAISILERVGDDHTLLTVEDIAHLKAYSGIGGTDTQSDTGGHIHEYYTPKEIAAGVWDGLTAMGFSNGNSLEPSAGSGVFQETKPSGVVMTATEIDKTSSHINQLLHPDDLVLNQPFEEMAANAEDGTFDSCIGNVPFGKNLKADISKDPDYTSREISDIDGYFVARVIDKVKAGGLIGLVVPTRIISGTSNKKLRRIISEKAEFLGAHRLPSGVFSNAGTDVVTDIIFLQKHSDELAAKLTKSKVATLKSANVLWDTFISGKWFESSEGKPFVHGETSFDSYQNQMKVKNDIELTNEALKDRLSHKFESRIDFALLDTAETLQVSYIEGDENLINGRWMTFIDGEWLVTQIADESGQLDVEKYGASTVEQLERLLSSPNGALTLSHYQLSNVNSDFPYITKGMISDFFKLVSKLDKKYHEQVIRGSIVGIHIQALQGAEKTDNAMLSEAQNLVNAEFKRFGQPEGKISVLSGRSANYWNAFATSFDKDGNQSELLNGKVIKGEVIAFNSDDIAQTVGHLFSVQDLTPVTLEDFLSVYTGPAATLEELAAIKDIAITTDGNLSPLDRATTGDIVQARLDLLQAIGNEQNTAIAENYQMQLDEIERKRVRTELDNIDITMAGKWLPRPYITEFLRENGFTDIEYSKTLTDDEGNLYEDTEYVGADGIFSGYTTRNGKKRGTNGIEFERQLENYLNGVPIKSVYASLYKDRIKGLETEFGIWIRKHDDVETVANLYNDTFNGFIPVEHSGQPLNLKNTSGQIVNFDYQCAEIRRLSEIGTGICGFGTGLGKTATALGLVAYNTEIGRARRTALVVPKSVIENWYHETNTYFGKENLASTLFVDCEPVKNKDGDIEQETVLDDKGEPKKNPVTGDIMKRDVIKEVSPKERKRRLNLIPHGNYSLVVMTKERYKEIPLRPESVGAYVSKMVDQGMLGGKYVADAKKHREAMKNERFKNKFSDTGGEKKKDIPYFEDMAFDNVIVDEGHNYRNSYKAGRESGRIAYLPTQSSSQVAIDMALKGQYIKEKNSGRGVVMLTATPTVNSPTDIFNMLSHTMTPDEWQKLGIVDVDDFIRVFGETDEVPVQKLSGEVEIKTALVGFKNLSGLRSLFHKHVNLKTAKDVSETVAVPDIEDVEQECPMSAEQQDIYEELRERADALNKMSKEDLDELRASGEKVDSVFGLLREMDRVTTDIDLYNREMTFVLPSKYTESINKLVADLPNSLSITLVEDDKEDEGAEKEDIAVEHNARVRVEGESVILVVSDKYEDEVTSRLSKFDIALSAVSHPITPKYARMLEVLKAGMEDGKQIIFTEEKTQHNKLKRIIANHLGIDESKIGIINASTVAGKDADNQQASLEKLATKYNEGTFKILICNKKAEVGVNLHHGTSDVLHLTLPWVPSSLTQRNGRSARVGSKMKKVRAHYFVGKGSFDEFRLASLKRKAQWMSELFTSDADRMDNADANDADENSLLLAANNEERQARIEASKQQAVAKKRKAQTIRAGIDLSNYIKASHDLKADIHAVRSEATSKAAQVLELENEASKNKISIKYWREEEEKPFGSKYDTDQRRDYQNKLKDVEKALTHKKQQAAAAIKRVQRLDKAASQVARLRLPLKQAIKDGLIDAPEKVLDHGDKFLTADGKTYEVGKIYNSSRAPAYRGAGSVKLVYQVIALNFDYKTATVSLLYTSSVYDAGKVGNTETVPVSRLLSETSRTRSELELLQKMNSEISITTVADLLTKQQFYQYLESDTLKLNVSEGGSYSSSTAYLFNDGNSFRIENVYSSLESSDRKLVVYPDANDTSMKQRLAIWILDDREKRVDGYYAAKGFLTAIFGNSYVQTIEAYGNTATSTQITQWGSKILAEFLPTEEGIRTVSESMIKSYVSTYGISSYAKKLYPIEFDNHAEFEAHIKVIEERFTTHVNQLKTDNKDRMVKLINATYKVSLTASRDKQAELGKFLLNLAIMRAGATDLARNLKSEGSPFDQESDGVSGQLLAALELVTQQDSGIGTLVFGEFGKRAQEMFTFLIANQNTARMALGIAVEADETPDETTSRETANDEYTATASALAGTVTVDTITFKPNSSPLTLKAGRYAKAKDYEVGEIIGIQDTAAFDGLLYENKDELKALHKSVTFKNDKKGNTEYRGAWWFIEASATNLEELKKTIGIK